MKFFTELMDRIDALSLRERGAIFVAVLAVMFFIWDSYLMTDIKNSEHAIKAQLQQKQAERMALNVELQDLISNVQEDPNALNRKKLEMLRGELDKVKADVLKSTEQLVSPGRMAGILENVLAKTGGLDLLEVKGLGSTALLPVPGEKGGDKPAGGQVGEESAGAGPGELSNAYKHGLRIVFNGSYMSTLEYVRKLEELNSGFLWDSLELRVEDYPESRVAITVYTLSLDDDWIGV